MSNSIPSIDPSMLDLFHVEVQNHARALETGLLDAERIESPSAIEPLMRAAHSIKGAARIVGLHALVSLAHVMEDMLTQAQSGKRRLVTEDIDSLLAANDLFMELANGTAASIPAAIEARLSDIDELEKRITRRLEAPVEAPAVPQAPPPAPPKAEPAVVVDSSMLDLFRVELENHARALESGLVSLETDQSPTAVEPLMRAAHSIKGAARIVGLSRGVTLAHAMEDVLSAVQHGKLTIAASGIDVLLAGNDIFLSLLKVQTQDLPAQLDAMADDINRTSAMLDDIMKGRAAQPTQAPAASAPIAAPAPVTPAAAAKAPAAASPQPQAEAHGDDRFVRVPSGTLNRIIAFAGENLVQAKSMKVYSSSLLRLKALQQELDAIFETSMGMMDEELIPAPALERLHDAMARIEEIGRSIAEHREEFEMYSHRLEHLSNRLYDEVIISRMRPFSEGLHGFARMVRDIAKTLNKRLRFVVQGEATQVDRDILEKLEAPLNHLLRNAIDHGVGSPEDREASGKNPEGTLTLTALHKAGRLNISVSDDGRGIDIERLRVKVVDKGYVTADMAQNMTDNELLDFLFLPGFTTTDKVSEVSGRGVGLDVVMSMVQEVGGSIHVDSVKGKGTTFHLQLPITLSVIRALLVRIAGELYALPLSRIDRLARVRRDEFQMLEDRQFCDVQGERIGVVGANEIFALPRPRKEPEVHHVVVISDRLNRYGVIVDSFNGERDLVVIPLDPMLGKVPNISAGAIIEDGSPLLIIDVDDLVRSIDAILTQGKPAKIGATQSMRQTARKSILVVDDSLTVREVERKLLQNNGYSVTTAVDGMDGWNTLLKADFDLVITDIDMPRMNGFELVRRIKADPKRRDIPVMIVSYKDREEDRLKGLDAGANYYFSKSSFHDETMLDAVRDLIGEE
jgi:two-component system sensor histidine kinase and response regulator WspE